MPESRFVFRRRKCSTTSALPATQPTRQPVMFQPFESEKISTPTSFAPAVARKLGGLVAVEDDLGVGVVVDDDQVVRAGELDRPVEEALARPRLRSGCSGS